MLLPKPLPFPPLTLSSQKSLDESYGSNVTVQSFSIATQVGGEGREIWRVGVSRARVVDELT